MSTLLEKIRTADNLPSLPTVALEVLRLTRDENITLAELADVIQHDPALTAKILKVVNCSLFGYPKKIASLRQATIVLGIRTVKVMALSFSLVDSVQKRDGVSFDYAAFWRRSLTTAVSARLLAENLNPDLRDEAFVAGLLADIGMFAALSCAPEEYLPVVREYQTAQSPPQGVESRLLGATHAKISETLLRAWGLPDSLCLAAGVHHGEGFDDLPAALQPLASLVCGAALIADLFCYGRGADAVADTVTRVCECTGITDAKLDVLLQILDAKVAEAASLFNLEIGKVRNYLDVQKEAVERLVNLSVAAELESVLAAQQAKALAARTEELARQASTDALTQIANRASFDEMLEKAFQAASENARSLGLIMLDVDHFKTFNDRHGHQLGDEVLRHVGKCLAAVRNETRFPARYGGEEFAVLVLDATTEAVARLAEQIRSMIEGMNVPAGQGAVQVTASLGAAVATPADAAKPDQLVRRADESLYAAKAAGRNRVIVAK